MASDEELQDLVQRAQGGDRAAFDRLIEAVTPRLEALVTGQLGPQLRGKTEPQDLVQEVFMRAWSSLEDLTWRGEEAFWAWLGTLARHVIQNKARDLQAKKRRLDREVSLDQQIRGPSSGFAELVDLLKASAVSPSKALRRDERFERLKACLEGLGPEHRKVIFLVLVREIPIMEVARQMGRSREALSMLLLRALRKLKRAFGTTESFNLPDRRLQEEDG